MNKLLFNVCLLHVVIISFGQVSPSDPASEFTTNPNGLMYSDNTLKALRRTVDSLNTRFRSCPANPVFIANPQGKLWTVTFVSEKDGLKKIMKELGPKTEFQALVSKYQDQVSRVDTSQLVIRFSSRNNYTGEENIHYVSGTPAKGYDGEPTLSNAQRNHVSGKWCYVFTARDKYDSLNRLECSYIPYGLTSIQLPASYAGYLAYVDCMIDTNSLVNTNGEAIFEQPVLPELAEFKAINSYLNKKMHLRPGKTDAADEYKYFTESKADYAVTTLADDRTFLTLLANVTEACIENHTGSESIEFVTSKLLSPKKALEMKRSRRVVGFCSQDLSPRKHARDIAILAAETHSWDIFLRAHLDIMNDRFDRRSDGSYAYGMRQTYLKELETLNIDIVDLMLGLTLRAQNTAANHYNGTVWRLGRALAESSNAELFETKAVIALQDEKLDEFNRGLIYLLYQSYLNHLDDIDAANKKITNLKSGQRTFTPDIAEAIKKLELRVQQPGNW